ncbi:MAG: hypothetical protein J0H49_08325 [Acidobacteria bacterium]|nr:hypothetical protein [Acidobacteriota bacterium]
MIVNRAAGYLLEVTVGDCGGGVCTFYGVAGTAKPRPRAAVLKLKRSWWISATSENPQIAGNPFITNNMFVLAR